MQSTACFAWQRALSGFTGPPSPIQASQQSLDWARDSTSKWCKPAWAKRRLHPLKWTWGPCCRMVQRSSAFYNAATTPKNQAFRLYLEQNIHFVARISQYPVGLSHTDVSRALTGWVLRDLATRLRFLVVARWQTLKTSHSVKSAPALLSKWSSQCHCEHSQEPCRCGDWWDVAWLLVRTF